MLKRDGTDIVTICTPAALHLLMALDAAAAGKHCIAEKPIEINVERTLRVIEAVRGRDRRGGARKTAHCHRPGGIELVKLIMDIYGSSRKNERMSIG